MSALHPHAPEHPPRAQLELYVLGALDAGPMVRLERHVSACADCAAALAREARLENTLRALVPRARAGAEPVAKVVHLPSGRPPAPRASLSSAMAAAAALIVGVWGLGAELTSTSSRALGRGGASPALARAAESEGQLLACELDPDEPLCRWPTALVGLQSRATRGLDVVMSDDGDARICRAPVGGTCSIQSRIP